MILFSRATDSGTSSMTWSGILIACKSTYSKWWNSASAWVTSSPVAYPRLVSIAPICLSSFLANDLASLSCSREMIPRERSKSV